ncbi:helix-turn-helix domain-containing protein [Pseudobutyrivibrio sp. ACV-2]
MKYENIELLRLRHELTQGEVADVLGCHREVYRRYEKGT